MIRKCAICGKIFRSKAPRAKYCSPACTLQGVKQRRAQWEKEHPEYMRTYNREYRKRHDEKDQGRIYRYK